MPEPVETSTPDVAAVPVPEPELSLSEHIEAFGPIDPSLKGDELEQVEEKREKIRHRAKSQQAPPEDTATINALTARLRAAESAAGISRNTGESDRVYNLRVRAELAEAARVSRTPAPASAVAPISAPPAVSQQQSAQTLQPTRAKPSVDEIGTKYPTYEDFTADQSLWVWEQQDQQRQHGEFIRQQSARQAELQRQWQQTHQTYGQRADAFAATHPDFTKLVTEHQGIQMPPALYHAIITVDNGPELLHYLLTRPDQLAEAVMLYRGADATEQNVALATRWLSHRAQAAHTGSVAPTPPLPPAPRPPNPVRTGPMTTSDDPPGDDSSLAQHMKAYGPKSRR